MPRRFGIDTSNRAVGGPMITRRDVDDLQASMRDAQRYLAAERDPARSRGEVLSRVVRTAEVGAGAAGVGLLAGRLGTTQIGNTGIPLGLAVGAVGHTLAFFGLAGRFDEHVHNVSDGALAGWATMWGAGQGRLMRERAGLPTGPITAGMDGIGNCPPHAPPQLMPAYSRPQQERPLTEAELQIMAANAR